MRVGIALGSNLGDRLARLRNALAALREFGGAPLLTSRVYETAPVDCPPGSSAFLNAAVELGFDGSPESLLARLQGIECAQDRPAQRSRNAPRTVDLDLIYADDLRLATPALTLPHPRATERLFVVAPFSDICPDRILPGASRSFSAQRELLEARGNETITVTEYILS